MKLLFISNKKWGKDVYLFYNKNKKFKCDFSSKTSDIIKKITKTKYNFIFVLHWGFKINSALIKNNNFIGFHASDLPKFNGGSPIQNQIIRGIKKTKLTTFFMDNEYDSGPIILKKKLDLSGSIDDIFERCKLISIKLIERIIKLKKIKSTKQKNVGKKYERLNYNDNNLKKYKKVNDIYNCIRMVDSNEYSKAYLEINKYLKLEFSRAKKYKNKIFCEAKILYTR